MVSKNQVNFVDVAPNQIVSITTSCIPFLEHDDATRALMGANMQRQAIPLLKPEAAFVATGIEAKAAKDSGVACVCEADGVVEYADAKKIEVKTAGGKDVYYFEVKIADTTKEYEFGVELTDGDKKETRLSCTLDAKDLDIADRTGNPSAEYISEDTVRIWWTPATKKSDESEWAPANYTVYVKDENEFFDTITDIEVKEDSKVGKVVYYVEYTVEDNEEDYTFEVVLTIDGDYVDIKEVEVDAYKSTETTVFNGYVYTDLTSFDNSDLFANDAVLNIHLVDDVQPDGKVVEEKVEFVKYKVLNDSADFIFPAEALLDSEFVELKVAENYNGDNKFIVKDLKEGDKVVFLYSIVEEDKEPYYGTTSTNVVKTTSATHSIYIAPKINRADEKSNVTVSFELSTTSLKSILCSTFLVKLFFKKFI